MSKRVTLMNTRFYTDWFETNFAGDPQKGFKGSKSRKGSIVIPEDKVEEFMRYGAAIKSSRPPRDVDENDYTPTYYCTVVINMQPDWIKDCKTEEEKKERLPHIFLVKDGVNIQLSEEELGLLDSSIKSVTGSFDIASNGCMYAVTMYCEVGEEIAMGRAYVDPFADLYPPVTEHKPGTAREVLGIEQLPFDN